MPMRPYPINSIVKGTIKWVDARKVGIRLEDGSHALLREREIAWDEKKQVSWLRNASAGDRIQAKVIRYDRDNTVEVSLKVMDRDPWDEITARYSAGSLVRGIVTGMYGEDIFVALEPGVDGLLRRSELSVLPKIATDELLQTRDSIYVIVQVVKPDERRLFLTFDGVRSRRWGTKHANASGFNLMKSKSNEFLSENDLSNLTWNDFGQSHTILIVDDDVDTSNAIVKALVSAGQQVKKASSASEAEKLLANLSDGDSLIVLMDRQMPEEQGDKAIQRLSSEYPNVKFVLMSHSFNPGDEIYWPSFGVPLVYKPLDRFSLASVIHRAVGGASRTVIDSRIQNTTINLFANPSKRISDLLVRARDKAKAQRAILFEVSGDRTQVAVAEQTAGVKPLGFATDALIHSPVNDVTQSKLPFICEDAFKSEKTIKHLRSFIYFEACLGIYTPALLKESFALFLFYDSPQKFHETNLKNMMDDLATYSEIIGVVLEQRGFLAKMVDQQRMVIAGELSSVVTHDIFHHMGYLNGRPKNLRESLNSYLQLNSHNPYDQYKDKADKELNYLYKVIGWMQDEVSKINKTTQLFNLLSLQSKDQYQRIDIILGQAVELAEKLAYEKGVEVNYSPEKMIITRTHETSLMHVLQNIVLNAIQQTSRMPKDHKRRILISIKNAEDLQKKTVVQIRVEDNGPGIHASDFESIFELGVTNRAGEGGSGIGLYLAKMLVEQQLKGHIMVEDSSIYWGSCFLIQLPWT